MSLTTPAHSVSTGTTRTARGGGVHRSTDYPLSSSFPRRLPESLATVGLFIAVFCQHPGRIVRDTKLDLAVDPGSFMATVSHLWNPLIGFGSVPDQAYGYLFPMGSYYWLGSASHLPEWIVQRLWMGLLLSTALWGTILLAESLRIGGRWSRLAGGIAYALSPLILAQAHDTAFVIPVVLLPWVMVPLIRASDGVLTTGGAAARSGVAVLLMGGVNASASFAVLLLPLIWFVTRRPIRQYVRLFVFWVIAIGLATAWFVVPLVFQRKYGFNFLPYTETASTTTSISFIPEVLRGGGDWTSLIGPPIWTSAGYMVETSPVVIVASSVIAGLGLYGLARRNMPNRLFLVLAVTIGLVLVAAGYWGHFGGPFASTVHTLLDGPLAAFRNVAKFQPIITLALALGLVHALEQFVGSLRKLQWPGIDPLLVGLVVATILALGLSAAPLITGKLYPSGSYTAIPTYWYQATNWINARGAMSNTLVVPGSSFARLTWGNPLDQPLEPLATVPWANRNISQLSSIGNTQFLDALDQVLAGGQPVPGLDQYLARAGVRYLVVENDLNPAESQTPPPVEVRTVLANEYGISRVAGFGPVVRDPNSGPDAEHLYDPLGVTHGIRSLEVYRVAATGSGNAMVTTYPASTGIQLSGGPQGLLPLAGTTQLDHQAVASAGDPLGPTFETTIPVVTDTQQLRDTEFSFSSLYNGVSYLLSPGQPAPLTGGKPQQWIVVPGAQHETVSQLSGAAAVSASSSGSLFVSTPGDQPLAAFIDNAAGATWEATPTDARPWIEIRFDHPIPLREITVTPSTVGTSRITRVQVATERGQSTASLEPRASPQSVSTPVGSTRFLRLTIVGIQGPRSPLTVGPGFAHIAIPGVTVTQSWRVPNDVQSVSGITPTYLFSSPLPNQFDLFSATDEEPQLSRTFTVPEQSTLSMSGQVTPRTSSALEAVEFPIGAQPVTPLADLKAPFAVACGSGPTLTIDGTRYETSVSGTVGDFYALRTMPLAVCTPGGTVALAPGAHTVTADDAESGFKVTGLSLIGTPVQPSTAPRAITVEHWGAESRTLIASGGQAALLNVHQNYNPGWVATVNGHQLKPVRLDGWQQGWVLPASVSPQVVRLEFPADGSFRLILLVGGALATALVVWALLPARRRRTRQAADRRVTGYAVAPDGVPNGRTVSSDIEPGEDDVDSPRPWSRAGRWAAWTVLTACIFVVAGPVALVVPLVVGLRWAFRGRPSLAWLALGAEVLAGLAFAIHPAYRVGAWVGSGSYTAQALGGLAVAALVLSLLPGPRRRKA